MGLEPRARSMYGINGRSQSAVDHAEAGCCIGDRGGAFTARACLMCSLSSIGGW